MPPWRIVSVFAIAGFLFGPPAGTAAAQIVVGRVVDGTTGDPIQGARIEARAPDSVAVATALSDSAGFVQLRLPSAGSYFIVASRTGLLPWQSGLISIAARETLEVEIRLGRDAVPLDPLVVVARARSARRLAGYRSRLQDGRVGRFVTREDIERRPSAPVSDLVRPLSGVHIVDVARGGNPNALSRLIAMRGNRGGEIADEDGANYCLPGLFVDGVKVSQSAEFPIDDFIMAYDLEGIEVYSTAGSVPIEYQQGGGVACGAVLFWTREAQTGEGRSGWWRWAVGLGAFAGVFLLMR